MPSAKKLHDDYVVTETRLAELREAIVAEIAAQLAAADITVYAFCQASGINRGNLHNMLANGVWNRTVALQSLEFLSTPIRDREARVAKQRLNGAHADA